jgi:hypothetical protein
VERPQVSAVGDRMISRLGCFQRLLGHANDNSVDRAVDRLNALKVRLNYFLTGNLSGSDRFASSVALMRHSSVAVLMLISVSLPCRWPSGRQACFSADIKTPSRWSAVAAPEGSRLKTTLVVFRPYLERSIRKTYGSCLSSGCS